MGDTGDEETNVQWNTTHFVGFLRIMFEKIPAKDIYLIGHSMGNRVPGHGFTKLASDLPKNHFALY